jgi:Raf kinase inhibitor-like YbhB/YbcL family protein
MADTAPTAPAADAPETITLACDAFAAGDVVPQRYTCDGTDTSPPLRWTAIPDGTAELVVVAEDPDAADPTFLHWMVAGLEPHDPGALDEGSLPEPATVGLNDFEEADYRGPCPPHDEAPHRYVFTLLAAGTSLALHERFSASDLAAALDGNVLAKGVLTVRYGRRALTGPSPPTASG